jgi:hypothetical protein
MFYVKGVDIANTKSMWNFLKEHFTYNTLNSWNRQTSIANNVKLYNLNLDGDWGNVLSYIIDAADCGGLQALIDDEIRDFDERHYPLYRAGFNGRSSGYLVLYNMEDNTSVLPNCVADYDSYEDFKEDVKAGWNNYRVSDFDHELRRAVKIVRDFDRLCDKLRDIVNGYSTRSFDVDKLVDAVERFNNDYYNDLVALELSGPELEGDKIALNDIKNYNAFMHCFFEYFGDDRRRITSNDTHLWLKEA